MKKICKFFRDRARSQITHSNSPCKNFTFYCMHRSGFGTSLCHYRSDFIGRDNKYIKMMTAFLNVSDLQLCFSSCHHNCKTCYEGEANNCKSCYEHYSLTAFHTCALNKTCPNGLFKTAQLGNCEPCHKDCDTCHGPSDLDCTSCPTGRYD